MGNPGGDDPPEHVRGRVVRDLGPVAGEQSRDERGAEGRDEEERDRDHDERDRESGELASEPAFVPGERELGQHRDPDRLRGDHDDDEEPVRGEQAVGLRRAAELARDHDADRRRDRRDDEEGARGERAARDRAQADRICTLAHRRGSVRPMPNDSLWTGRTLDELRTEFGDVYEGRTVLVTGADGFMGSHLTDALVEIGANVHAFVRATSSGALNNIGSPP